MRNYIEGLPHHHSQVRGHFEGVTDSGLNFDLEVHTEKMPLNTHARAKRLMDLRIQAAKRAEMEGKPLGVWQHYHVCEAAAEEVTRILLRISAPGKIYRIPVTVNLDGSYSADGVRCGSLRQIVRETARTVEARHGMGRMPVLAM